MRKLELKLGYDFRNKTLLRNALTHSSFANENRGTAVCNERLEFLGDSILGLVVADFLYQQYPHMPEGQMTRLRSELVCEQSLVHVAQELELGDYLRLGRGEERSGGHRRPSILADAVEATIAAIYLDGGMTAARTFVTTHILAALETEKPFCSTDYKTALQELVQRQTGQSLEYTILSESGPDHNKTFTAQVSLNGDPVGTGTGGTKKESEQAAAHAALQALQSPKA